MTFQETLELVQDKMYRRFLSDSEAVNEIRAAVKGCDEVSLHRNTVKLILADLDNGYCSVDEAIDLVFAGLE